MSEPTAHRTAPEWNGTATPAAPPSNPWSLLPELLRNAFASLVLAIGFAGLARRERSGMSLLAELQLGWQQLRTSKLSLGRGSRHTRSSDEDYIRQISGEQE